MELAGNVVGISRIAAWVLSVPLWVLAVACLHNAIAYREKKSFRLAVLISVPPICLVLVIGTWWYIPVVVIVLAEWVYFAMRLKS